MRIVFEHLVRHVASDSHNRLVRGLRFSKLRNCLVPQIVEAQPREMTLNLPNVGSAFGIRARLPRLLHSLAGWTFNDSRQFAPS